jgi:hypothetical protein
VDADAELHPAWSVGLADQDAEIRRVADVHGGVAQLDVIEQVVNWKIMVAPTRPSFQMPISLDTVASRFQVGWPRSPPATPAPQLASNPRDARAQLVVDRDRVLEQLGADAAVVVIVEREGAAGVLCVNGREFIGRLHFAANTAPSWVPPLGRFTSPNDWQPPFKLFVSSGALLSNMPGTPTKRAGRTRP